MKDYFEVVESGVFKLNKGIGRDITNTYINVGAFNGKKYGGNSKSLIWLNIKVPEELKIEF